MGVSTGGLQRGTIVDLNIVPLIDILLVLLVVFMILTPLKSLGLPAQIPQQSEEPSGPQAAPDPSLVVVEVLENGSLRINQQPVDWARLEGMLSRIFAQRVSRVAFVKGQKLAEFGAVARLVDLMHSSGITSVGLLDPEFVQAQ